MAPAGPQSPAGALAAAVGRGAGEDSGLPLVPQWEPPGEDMREDRVQPSGALPPTPGSGRGPSGIERHHLPGAAPSQQAGDQDSELILPSEKEKPRNRIVRLGSPSSIAGQE